jgi:hypothetical protein
LPSESDFSENWENWLLASSMKISEKRQRVQDGAEFIRWFFLTLPWVGPKCACQKSLGEFYAQQAFLAEKQGLYGMVWSYAFLSIQYDRDWLLNGGLLKITILAFARRVKDFIRPTRRLTVDKRDPSNT